MHIVCVEFHEDSGPQFRIVGPRVDPGVYPAELRVCEPGSGFDPPGGWQQPTREELSAEHWHAGGHACYNRACLDR